MSFVGWLSQPAVLPWAALVFGLCVGSFLNVVIHRLPKMLEREWRAQCAELAADGAPATAASGADEAPYNLWTPRSACPGCNKPIPATHNIPLVSWIALRARCANCGMRISARYPLVELAGGVVAGYAALRFGATLVAFGAMVYCWAMIALTVIDLDTLLLPDDITLPLLWAGLVLNLDATYTDIASAVIGAAAGYLSLWLVFWAFKLATGKEGMGYGDFKLLAAIGAWVGWKILPLVILLSSFVGALAGVLLIVLARHGRNVPIPFGPYLAIAGLVALFHGEALTRHYLDLF
jgi:leader peptidase (prepilin peptidase) / N-methyltransferase